MIDVDASKKIGVLQRVLAWMIHGLTASGAFIGLLALLSIEQHNFLQAFWLMTMALLIDSIDGMCARKIQVKQAVPQVDGALLDNIVDFLNYTIVPCFLLLATDLLPASSRIACVMMIVLASAYQFTQVDAKTQDHFFKGFPSYWNITVFYLFFWQFGSLLNILILVTLAVMSFIPIKYVYPSRMDNLTHNTYLRWSIIVMTGLWGISTSRLLWIYPQFNVGLAAISLSYLVLYFGLSLYRTWIPLTASPSTVP